MAGGAQWSCLLLSNFLISRTEFQDLVEFLFKFLFQLLRRVQNITFLRTALKLTVLYLSSFQNEHFWKVVGAIFLTVRREWQLLFEFHVQINWGCLQYWANRQRKRPFKIIPLQLHPSMRPRFPISSSWNSWQISMNRSTATVSLRILTVGECARFLPCSRSLTR